MNSDVRTTFWEAISARFADAGPWRAGWGFKSLKLWLLSRGTA
jgi:hypothetical protein